VTSQSAGDVMTSLLNHDVTPLHSAHTRTQNDRNVRWIQYSPLFTAFTWRRQLCRQTSRN